MSPSSSLPLLLPLLLTLTTTTAREITFPPLSPYQNPLKQNHAAPPPLAVQNPYSATSYTNLSHIDLSVGSAFSGLTTYANLPHVHCLSSKESVMEGEAGVERYDVAVLGAPFDTGVTARPGARFGPGGIRAGSRRIYPDGNYDTYTGDNIFADWAKIVDCGDAPLTFLDNTVALKQLNMAHEIISGRPANSSEYPVPRIVTLGGDHTTTLSALRSTFKRWGPVSVIHFDSHIDTWNPKVLGGGISHYAGVNHGTFLHIAHEEHLILNTSIHAGIRAPVFRPKDITHDRSCGFSTVQARDIDLHGVRWVVDKLRERVKGTRVYVSVDIDVLDPAFAPATGTAEVGGWTTRELLTILDALEGIDIVGADVVEVAPIYDNPGETTVLAAAGVVRSLIGLMVAKPVKP